MKLISFQPYLKIFTSLQNAIFLLGIIALLSSIGSVIEQDETLGFYQENYSSEKPIYGFIDWKLVLFFGLDHIYTTWWFSSLLILLAICLTSCTISRQFPTFITSKDYLLKQQQASFFKLPFFVRLKNISYIKESFLVQLQQLNFYVYQKNNLIYGYKGLVGRISPILVHLSLLIILFGSSASAFLNFKAQEFIPKGEIFHIQNPLKIGFFTSFPGLATRVNDFWVEYENNRIHQFYSNLSILDTFGKEVKNQTISVNNPLRYKQIDFYQSDWNLVGVRIENLSEKKIYEFPLFSFQKKEKAWITWVVPTKGENKPIFDSKNILSSIEKQEKASKDQSDSFILIINQLQNLILVYNKEGQFLDTKNVGDLINSNLRILEIIPSTGLLIKYDPIISLIYLGFGLLMITALLSYLPYTQIWIVKKKNYSLIGSTTNRGKIQLELDFENLIRSLEKKLLFFQKK